jgi:hypothetical protein
MAGYAGEYGEGFLGIGYSHSSFVATAIAPDGTDTAPMSTGIETPYSGANDSQPVFVAAKIRQDAEAARAKAQDILRNILHSTGSGSAEHNRSNNDSTDPDTTSTANSSNISSAKNRDHNYYAPQEGLISTNADATAHVPPSTTTTEIAPTQQSIEKDAEIARLKAMDILRKFQSQPDESAGNNSNNANLIPHHHHHDFRHPQPPTPSQPQQPQSPMMSSLIPTVIPTSVPIVMVTPPWELAKRRRECLEKDEERKQRALFKNLRYVARLEEERLVQQLEEVQQIKTLEQQIDERYQQKMEHRQNLRKKNKKNIINNGSNNINTSGAGIGTKQRRKAEAKRQKTALPPSLRKNHTKGNRGGGGGNNNNGGDNNGSGSVAIYVSNLPTDGSFDDEATIRGLFSAYGSLRKVHFYMDKTTGKKKGDALVIYSLKEGEEEVSLMESVCSQVGTYNYRDTNKWDRRQ